MDTLSNVIFLGVEANTPSDGVIAVRINGRGVGEVYKWVKGVVMI